MKKITFLLLAMGISLAIVWGIVAVPMADVASDTNKLAEQHFEKAVKRIRQLMYEDAIAELEKVIKLVPKSEMAQDAQYWIGQSYCKAGKYDEALSTFQKLTEEYPESAIIPVAQLMVGRVQQEKKSEKLKRAQRDTTSEKGIIVDPKTGVRYTKTKILAGKKDVIQYTTGLNPSPNGEFLLHGNLVVPLDGGDPFELVDMPAGRGTWSPDGKKAAFYSKDAIWVIPVSPEKGYSTGPPKKLLDGKYRFQLNVSWSPDGEKFAFTRRDEEFSRDIWTISVDDGSLNQITSTPEWWEFLPAWSPDGKTIAYERTGKEHKHSLWLSSVDGETARKIVDSERMCIPIWSPDGKWIFLFEPLRFIHLADRKEYALTKPEGVGDFFSWSPDGKKMLFYHPSYDYRSALKVVSVSGGPTLELGRQLTLSPYEHFWSPDNKMIITEGEDKEGNCVLWIIPLTGGESFPIELDVTVTKPIPLCLSRDCKKFLFSVRKSDGTEDFWAVPISLKDARTTGSPVKLFKGRQRGRGGASLSPDGSKIAISHEGDVWIANVEGGKRIQLTKTPEIEGWPGWSRDGKMVCYIVESAEGRIFHLMPASGGKEIMRLEAFDDLAWSPDGKELAVAFRNDQLSVISIASGKTRRIADLKDLGLTEVYDLCWSPDGRDIACVGYHTEKEQSGPIFIIPVEGGKATEVATDDQGAKYWLYWSPDGKWISYQSDGFIKTRPEGEIWEADFEEILKKISD